MGGQPSQQINYLYPMPNSKEPGFTPVYRHPKFHQHLMQTPDSSVKTYRDVILESCLKKYPNNKLAGKIIITKQTKDGKQTEQRTIQSLTYRQCFDQAQLLGKGLLGHKLQYTEKTQGMKFVGIYSKNRVEWLLADFACTLFGLTTIPLYDTLGVQNLVYCLDQTQMTTVFLTEQTLNILFKLKDHGNLKNVILFDRVSPQIVKQANKLGLNVVDFQTLMEDGKKFPNISYRDVKIQPTDIYTFSYTSGTTGPPKGAMLCHRNFTAFLAAFNNHDIKFQQSDVYLSFLPLPHVFERVVLASHVYIGSNIVFYSGDMLKIKDDCRIVQPTIFIAVPRIFNRIVEKVQEGFNEKTGITKCLVDSAVSSKLSKIQNDGNFTSPVYDSIVFSKVKQAFGGKVRKMISGSAPLSVKSYVFMEMIMSAPMYEGYGQTENTAAAFVKGAEDKQVGHLGGIVPNMEFKLCDIPEMKYTSDDKDQKGRPSPRGQIWLRGPAIFSGYYKLKEKTEEAITKDGWLKTGDVAVLSAEGGRMKIIDRKKNIFKLQQGQYIAPQKVQDVYAKSPYVQEVFLHGQSTHNFCVAIIKPRKDHFQQLAKKNNIAGTYQELCRKVQMRRILVKQLANFAKSSGLNSLEQAKNIYLQSSPFVDKKILTNTMKLQRFQAKTVYKQIIDQLYAQGELPTK